MEIKDYQIEMLNVDDADAFIVYYITDDNKPHLVLIDAGRYSDGSKVMEQLTTYYSGIPIELAIVTHPDDDHFGGFIYLLEQIRDGKGDTLSIEQFWVNDPRNHFTIQDVEEDLTKQELTERLTGVYTTNEKNLLDIIDAMGIPRCEVFAYTNMVYVGQNESGNKIYKKTGVQSPQPGFWVLGPSQSFYEKVCTDFRYKKKLTFVEEISEDQDFEDAADFKHTDTSLSKVLDEADNDPSNHNKSCLILLFKPNKDVKILFTGDASVESFEVMDPVYKSMCKDVSLLKVPHHGSKANLNSKWIRWFNPNVAYISTLRRGKYLNQCTINALKKNGSRVLSTHANKDVDTIVHHNIMYGNSLKTVNWS